MDKANKLKTPREQRFENRIIVKSSSSSSITVKTASSKITKTCNNSNIVESSEPLNEKLNISNKTTISKNDTSISSSILMNPNDQIEKDEHEAINISSASSEATTPKPAVLNDKLDEIINLDQLNLSEHDVSINGTISELDDETGEFYDEKDLNSVADTFEASNSAAAAVVLEQDETEAESNEELIFVKTNKGI